MAVIGVPSNAGARHRGIEEAPAAFRKAGLVPRLRGAGVRVLEDVDLAEVVVDGDARNPREQNREVVASVARAVAQRVDRARRENLFALVLGGDCTITLGAVSGLCSNGRDVGVLYFDGDLDLNTPDTTTSGIFDGMVAAHLLGEGAADLARLGPRYPLVRRDHLVFFASNLGTVLVDPPERAALGRLRTASIPLEDVDADPDGSAMKAVDHLDKRVDRFLLHFDVDATDLPGADLPHRGALAWASAVRVLEVVAASPRCAGLVVTEFNPRLDGDGSSARRVVDALARALGRAQSA